MKLIFERGAPGRCAIALPEADVPDEGSRIPEAMLRGGIGLPQVSEVELVRHFTSLSSLNFGVDSGFYPLGSCTMKYNPKVNEEVANSEGFTGLHPYQPEGQIQGALELMFRLSELLCRITGMDAFSLQPAAGAHAEFTALLIAKSYFKDRGEMRTKVLVPDSAHGTNPASAAMCGYDVVEVPSNDRGCVDWARLRDALTEDTAVLMLTNPNTLGLFEEKIVEICDAVHDVGALAYCDGANMNAIGGIARPGDMGFDMIHLNPHKTFSAPHGGGGPGSGPVGVKRPLEPYLPVPLVVERDGVFSLSYERPKSIGKVRSFYGNFPVLVRTYSYIIGVGGSGLRQIALDAVLNANYLRKKLERSYEIPYNRLCKHEFVLSCKRYAEKGVTAMDMAKRIMDYGFHPPTVYFPLIVKEAMMIEPTETEGKEVLDEFAEAMVRISEEAQKNPELVRGAPHTTPSSRLDALAAARRPNLKWEEEK